MTTTITVDTGGTFTDVVVSVDAGELVLGKALTDHDRVFNSIDEALRNAGFDPADLIPTADLLVYATTRSTNAVIEAATARTAFLTTAGFPDVLVLREGGRSDAFDYTARFPEPYVARNLTYEIDERIAADGTILRPLDEAAAIEVITTLRERKVEAVAVSLLWSIIEPVHELRMAELLEEFLPGVPYSLGHRINPIIREYRRASAASIDASLKPLMQTHLHDLASDLRAAGFSGELMAATSFGGVMHIDDLAERPIYSVRSGPSLAPVAGWHYGSELDGVRDLLVCDTGGTSFDVSLVKDGEVVFASETWLGGRYSGHLTGLSSVDARSIGAGGGSIAWLDDGGLLRVGPQSAGSTPGPAAYGLGGTEPTITDAAVVLGYLNPDRINAGTMQLDRGAALEAVAGLGDRLGLGPEQMASGILRVANEQMVRAIHEMTTAEGVDPRDMLLVAGGGAGGLGIANICAELGAPRAVVPRTAGGLSACGAHFSDVVREYVATRPTSSADFDFDTIAAVLAELRSTAEADSKVLGARGYSDGEYSLSIDARYVGQIWELGVRLPMVDITGPEDLSVLVASFHDEHERVFAVRDDASAVEILVWRLQLRVPRPSGDRPVGSETTSDESDSSMVRDAFFDGAAHRTRIFTGEDLGVGSRVSGPLIIEEPTTTVVVPPGVTIEVLDSGNYLMEVAP